MSSMSKFPRDFSLGNSSIIPGPIINTPDQGPKIVGSFYTVMSRKYFVKVVSVYVCLCVCELALVCCVCGYFMSSRAETRRRVAAFGA